MNCSLILVVLSLFIVLFQHFAEHVLADVDRHPGRDGQRDRVARPAIDLDQLAFLADAELGEVRVLLQVADDDVLNLAAQLLDRRR